MSLNQLYQKKILAHNRQPYNFGPLPEATHRGHGHDALCGDDLEMALEVKEGMISQARFNGEACTVTQASASMLTRWLIGRSIDEVRPAYEAFCSLLADPEHPPIPDLGELNALQPVGAFPARRGNACLPWLVTLKALHLDG